MGGGSKHSHLGKDNPTSNPLRSLFPARVVAEVQSISATNEENQS